MKNLRLLFLMIFIFISVLSATADVRLPAIIGSHMVLQQNTTVKIWGWCDAN
jgi:sialate O-acetylesterase